MYTLALAHHKLQCSLSTSLTAVLSALLVGLASLGTSRAAEPQPATSVIPLVAPVDLQRYAGLWYEQARLPNVFQRMCTGQVSASYQALADGNVRVTNRCAGKDSTSQVEGVARSVAVEGKPQAGRLQVSFVPSWLRWIPLVWGDYWVMQLDAAYQVSLVGTPDRKYLWVLSREPQLDDARLQAALGFAKAAGFDVAAVVKTPALPALQPMP